MKGYVDKYLQHKVSLIVKGLRRDMKLDCIIDTGFNGNLCLPVPLAVQLGLELSAEQEVEFADGTIKRELIFLGQTVIDNKERTIEISLTNSDEALLGCGLLRDQKLEIGFGSKTLTIAPEEGHRA